MANKRKTTSHGEKSSDKRAGKRKDRNRRVGVRIPELGYYLIVTDTQETEKNYFEGLRDSIPSDLKEHLVIKVEKAKTVDLVQKALELIERESQYRIPWIVLDRDQVKDFDKIIQTAEKNSVRVEWSNPCFEIWMYAYFGEMPTIMESYICCERFAEKFEKVTRQKYLKNDKNIYQKLISHGDEEKAIQLAERYLKIYVKNGASKPSEMWPASTVQLLVKEIQGKVKKFHDNITKTESH